MSSTALERTPEVAIAGVGFYAPGFVSLDAWRSGARAEQGTAPSGEALGRIWRRRAGPLARALADVSLEALGAAGVKLGGVPSVIGSSIGEGAALLRLLDQIWRGAEPVSPADFTLSVHNVASGLLSISSGNRGFTTSIAADCDTPASALLEGLGVALTTGCPVLVACGDEAAPLQLLSGDAAWDLAAAAVVLAPLEWCGPRRARLRVEWGSADSAPELVPAQLTPLVARNPQAGLLDLVDCVARARSGVLRLDRGNGRGFRAVLEAEATP